MINHNLLELIFKEYFVGENFNSVDLQGGVDLEWIQTLYPNKNTTVIFKIVAIWTMRDKIQEAIGLCNEKLKFFFDRNLPVQAYLLIDFVIHYS